MKRIDVAVGMVLLVLWGMINEYIHVIYNWLIAQVPYRPPPNEGLIFIKLLFNAVVWLFAVVMIGAAVWLAFHDDITDGVKLLVARRRV
jgi:hypothetical protein